MSNMRLVATARRLQEQHAAGNQFVGTRELDAVYTQLTAAYSAEHSPRISSKLQVELDRIDILQSLRAA